MAQRAELLEAALEQFPDGVALLGLNGELVFWNHAAEQITGFAGVELVSRAVPDALEPLLSAAQQAGTPNARGPFLHLRHKRGCEFNVAIRALVLRDDLGAHLGTGIFFHPAETLDSLPHGESGDESVEASQAELQQRLEEAYGEFLASSRSLCILWITVDQAHQMRKTHGAQACEEMLQKAMRTLLSGLREGEQIGRWGDDEFLVVSRDCTAEALADHTQRLAGLARTTEFRWWGDRASITVSAGAAQADRDEPLAELLARARAAMHASLHAGGNHITLAPGRQARSPS